jgi:hypothetical protein
MPCPYPVTSSILDPNIIIKPRPDKGRNKSFTKSAPSDCGKLPGFANQFTIFDFLRLQA